MKVTVGLAISAALALPAPSFAEPIAVRWMGTMTCGGWLQAPKNADSVERALLLNWVLGYESGVSMKLKIDLLGSVDQASVSAWLDQYCLAHPLDSLPAVAIALESELTKRRKESN